MKRVLAMAAVLVASAAAAHGGGLDSAGCHHDRKRGGYHCHGGGGGRGGGGGTSRSNSPRATTAPRQAQKQKREQAALPFGSSKAAVLARYPGAHQLTDGQVGVRGTEPGEPLLTCYRFVNGELAMLASILRPDAEPSETYGTTKEEISEKYGEPQEQDWRAEGRGRASIRTYKTFLISLREYELKSGPPMVQFTLAPANVLGGPQAEGLLSLSPVCMPAESGSSTLEL